MRLKKNLFIMVLLGVLVSSVFMVSAVRAGRVFYVDDDASVGGDGANWAGAFKYLQDALADAELAAKPVEIRVAQGTYAPDCNSVSPDGSGDKTAAFQLINEVTLKGGFAGDGEPDPNAWDVIAYKTILSGDLGGVSSDVILTADSVSSSTVLDGFIISEGVRGIQCNSAALIISNCIVENNGDYGIVTTGGSSVMITNCEIRNNLDYGVYHYQGGNPVIANSLIHHNGDSANSDYSIFILSLAGHAVIRNNTIVHNTGRGIYSSGIGASAELEISNCILWGNVEDDLLGCSATYSCIQDQDAGLGNIGDNPDFAYDDPELYNFHLFAGSPCIDTGDPNNTLYCGQTDIDGDARVINGKYDKNFVADMGADEFSGDDVYSDFDYNADGLVEPNEIDLVGYAAAWLSRSESIADSNEPDENWDGYYDFVADGIIDLSDFVTLSNNWLWEACWRRPVTILYDFNNDGVVKIYDLSVLQEAWLSEHCQQNFNALCDYDDSGVIDMVDFAIFAAEWR